MEPTELSLASLEITILEAVVELMFLAAYADGEIQDAERSAFAAQIARGTNGQLTPDVVAVMLAHIEKDLAGADREARLARIRERIPARMRHEALTLAIHVVIADGVLKLDEVAFLKRAARALDVNLEVSDSVLQEAKD